MSGDLAELLLGNQKSGPDPAFPLIAAMPALHVLANLLHNRERRLDDIGAGQRLAQLHRDVKPMDSQRLLHSFAQAPRRARIEVHQFAMQRVQRLLGSRVINFLTFRISASARFHASYLIRFTSIVSSSSSTFILHPDEVS